MLVAYLAYEVHTSVYRSAGYGRIRLTPRLSSLALFPILPLQHRAKAKSGRRFGQHAACHASRVDPKMILGSG